MPASTDPTPSPAIDPAFRERVSAASIATLRREYPAERTTWERIMRDDAAGLCVVSPLVQDFRDFLYHFGPKPAEHWSLDRLDNTDLEYSPTKARWASPTTQANNRSNTRLLTGPRGEERPLTEWARRYNQKPDAIRKRLDRGWSPVEAITGRRNPAPAPAAPSPAAPEPAEAAPSPAAASPAPPPPASPIQPLAGSRLAGAEGWPAGLPETPAWTRAHRQFAIVIGGPEETTRAMFLVWVLHRSFAKLCDLRDRAMHRDMPDIMNPDDTYAPGRSQEEIAAWAADWGASGLDAIFLRLDRALHAAHLAARRGDEQARQRAERIDRQLKSLPEVRRERETYAPVFAWMDSALSWARERLTVAEYDHARHGLDAALNSYASGTKEERKAAKTLWQSREAMRECDTEWGDDRKLIPRIDPARPAHRLVTEKTIRTFMKVKPDPFGLGGTSSRADADAED